MKLGEEVWQLVYDWDYFEKQTIGKQIVSAADSIAANVSEGYGRFHFLENKRFCHFSRGSLFETKTWLEKARNRNLIAEKDYQLLISKMNILGKMLNAYIKSIGTQSK